MSKRFRTEKQRRAAMARMRAGKGAPPKPKPAAGPSLPPRPGKERIMQSAKSLADNPVRGPTDLQFQAEAEHLAMEGINHVGPDEHGAIEARTRSIEKELREAVDERDLNKWAAPRRYDAKTFKELRSRGTGVRLANTDGLDLGRETQFGKMSTPDLVKDYLALYVVDQFQYEVGVKHDPERADRITEANTQVEVGLEAELRRRGYSKAELYRLRGELWKESRALYEAGRGA